MIKSVSQPFAANVTSSVRVAPSAVLRVSGLTVDLAMDGEPEMRVLNDVSFALSPGEVLGVLGESGAGKSTLALSLLGLLPRHFRVSRGTVELGARQLLDLPETELRTIRGAEISIVHQDSSVLNPVMRVVDQVAEVLRAHNSWNMRVCREEARAILDTVGLSDGNISTRYPHELSGGQKQRVVIAQALACRPAVVIADEPTASLDITTAREILDLLIRVKDTFHTVYLLISHQPQILAYAANRVMVMYRGEIVEEGPTHGLFDSPLHPYTQALLLCSRPLQSEIALTAVKPHWPTIPTEAPDLRDFSRGCVFENRCLQRMEICSNQKPAKTILPGLHEVHCFEYEREDA